MKFTKIILSLIVLLCFSAIVFASPPNIGKSESKTKAVKVSQTQAAANAVTIENQTACRDVSDNDFAVTPNNLQAADTIAAANQKKDVFSAEFGSNKYINQNAQSAEHTNKIFENKRAWSNIDYPIKS